MAETKIESAATKDDKASAGKEKVVDFLGDPAPKASELDLLPEQTGAELDPEEAKAAKQVKKQESIAATGGGYPDSPSGRALAEVGDLDGEDADSLEQSYKRGVAYGRAKRKWRWGY